MWGNCLAYIMLCKFLLLTVEVAESVTRPEDLTESQLEQFTALGFVY